MNIAQHLKRTVFEDQLLVTLPLLISEVNTDTATAKQELWKFYKANAKSLICSFLVQHITGSKLTSAFVSGENLESYLQELDRKTILDMVLYAVRTKQQKLIEIHELFDSQALETTGVIKVLPQKLREKTAIDSHATAGSSLTTNKTSNKSTTSGKNKENAQSSVSSKSESIEPKPKQTMPAAPSNKNISKIDRMNAENENNNTAQAKSGAAKGGKRGAPAASKAAENEEKTKKKVKTEKSNTTEVDKDPEFNDPFHQQKGSSEKKNQNDEEECFFGGEVKTSVNRERIVDEKKEPKQPKKPVARANSKLSEKSLGSVTSNKSASNKEPKAKATDIESEEDHKPRMVKKVRTVYKDIDEEDEAGYITKKRVELQEEYWEEEKPAAKSNKPATATSKPKPVGKGQSSLSSFFGKK